MGAVKSFYWVPASSSVVSDGWRTLSRRVSGNNLIGLVNSFSIYILLLECHQISVCEDLDHSFITRRQASCSKSHRHLLGGI